MLNSLLLFKNRNFLDFLFDEGWNRFEVGDKNN